MAFRRWARSAAFVASILVCGTALASPSAHLVYSRTTAALSCPGEPELRKAVASRFGYDPFVAFARETVVVQITRQHEQYAARLQLVDAQGVARGTREFVSSAGDCREVFEASALAIGIALDAEEASPPSPAETPSASPSAAPAPSPPASQPAPPAPSPPEAPSATPPPSPPPAKVRANGGPIWSVLIDGLVTAGVAPAVAPGLAIGASVGVGPWSLGMEVLGDAPESASRAASLGGGRVESTLVTIQLVPCGRFSYFAFCGLGALGAIDAWGSDIAPHQNRATLFAAAGARIGFDVPLAGSFTLRVHADGFIDLHRPIFALGQDGQDEVWKAPPAGGTLGFGIARSFL